MMETIKPIPKYEGIYSISSRGTVSTISKEYGVSHPLISNIRFNRARRVMA